MLRSVSATLEAIVVCQLTTALASLAAFALALASCNSTAQCFLSFSLLSASRGVLGCLCLGFGLLQYHSLVFVVFLIVVTVVFRHNVLDDACHSQSFRNCLVILSQQSQLLLFFKTTG